MYFNFETNYRNSFSKHLVSNLSIETEDNNDCLMIQDTHDFSTHVIDDQGRLKRAYAPEPRNLTRTSAVRKQSHHRLLCRLRLNTIHFDPLRSCECTLKECDRYHVPIGW